jgi:RNA ligase
MLGCGLYGMLEHYVDKGLVRKCEMDNLVLYKYTEKCVYCKGWYKETRLARGLILNKDTGEIVAHPFPKFFNLNEMPESSYNEIIKHKEYEVYDKLDGSLGISYLHNGIVKIATVGSFVSEQAVEATDILLELYQGAARAIEKYDGITFLFEIIYPSNKIVCDYKGKRELVLLAAFRYKSAFDLDIGYEFPREWLYRFSETYGIPIVEKLNYTIDEMIALQKTLPKDKEGFVVRFPNGLRVKFKGEEYLRIHKLATECSPLSVWENMKYGKVPLEVTMNIPEEYLEEFKEIEKQLISQYWTVYGEVTEEFIRNFSEYYRSNAEWEGDRLVFNYTPTPEERKEVGLKIKNNPDKFKHASCMFPLILDKVESVDKYVMDYIRPKANKLDGLDVE